MSFYCRLLLQLAFGKSRHLAGIRILPIPWLMTVPYSSTQKQPFQCAKPSKSSAICHLQLQTSIQTDNSTTHALINNKILPKALKAMDMRFHCLKCCAAQGQYNYYWRPGTQNLADYFTKHHPASHHKSFWSQILTSTLDPTYLTLLTSKATTTKTFITKLLLFPKFWECSTPSTYTAACAKLTMARVC